jgi:excisionase family DNA binding protein
MTVNDVMAELRLSRATVYRLIEHGQIPAVKVGSSIRVDRDELRSALRPAAKEDQ